MKWPQNENAKNWDFSSKMKVVLNRLTENARRDNRGTKVTNWLKYREITKQLVHIEENQGPNVRAGKYRNGKHAAGKGIFWSRVFPSAFQLWIFSPTNSGIYISGLNVQSVILGSCVYLALAVHRFCRRTCRST